MKKYKLIKEYPGSPKLGAVMTFYDNIFQDGANFHLSLARDNSEFWQEVVEKNYLILKIQTNTHGRMSGFSYRSQAYADATLKCAGNTIHSIKRLSDGEVFTVGDYTIKDKLFLKIKSFKINGSNILIIGCDYLPNTFNYLNTILTLSELNTYKKPLFTTEDGVDILLKKDGEFQYWSLKLDNWKISDAPHILNSNKIIPTKTEDLLRCCNELRFSTKEAAEKYVLMNKPCLSINEVMYVKHKRRFLETLIEIVKGKL